MAALVTWALACLAVPEIAGALPHAWEPAHGPSVTVRDGRFVDRVGRHVLLHGVNLGLKQPPYVGGHGPEEFARMRDWGFNCIRLLVFWAAIEPECGRYDEGYLERLDERIAWAKAHGLSVVLDMHQDLYGEAIPGGGGAPAWATLDKGRPYGPKAEVWSDAYYTSPQVQAAFDSFWANAPGPDGTGIQERFALAWRLLAARYADEPAVIGYDLLNEPFIGSPVVAAPIHAAAKIAEVLADRPPAPDVPSLSEILQMTATSHGRVALIERLNDPGLYATILGAVAPVFQDFETGKLHAMHQRVAAAIRQADPRRILLLEPSVSANMGIPSALPLVTGPGEQPDPYQAFAPHAYDVLVDTAMAGSADARRIAAIVGGLEAHARRMDLPMLIGEWGAFYGSADAGPVAEAFARQFEAALASDTYWDSHEGLEKTAYFKALERPYPMAVAGVIKAYRADPGTRLFFCEWEEDPSVQGPSQFFVPAGWYPAGWTAELAPPGCGYTAMPISPSTENTYLRVTATGTQGTLALRVRPKP